jgi:cell division transport system permease protein
MSKQEKFVKRRLFASTISTVVSISLVLFMLGLVGFIILTSGKIEAMVKENIGFSVYLSNTAKEVEIFEIQKLLDAAEYVKSTHYISEDEAVEILRKDLDPNEDFIQFLDGHNPLPASIDVIMNASYAHSDSIEWIVADLTNQPIVKEVIYSKSLVDLVNDNAKQISIFILAFGGLLFIIAIALINNTIRLTIYSKRFLIRTMQLVGATRGFIRRPFLLKGIVHGMYASILAIAMLTGALYFVRQEVPQLLEIQDFNMLGSLFCAILITGILISWTSTFFAVTKYLKLKVNELYY